MAPALSTVKRITRGIEDLSSGEVERGIESMLPAGIANFWKANPLLNGRYVREGIVTRRGDPIYDDISSGELAAQMFGFAPNEYTKRQEVNMIEKKIDRTINENRTKLLRELYVATRHNDGERRNAAFKDIQKFNNKHPTFYISINTIQKSLRSHLKTSALMHNGVLLSSGMRKAIEEQTEALETLYE